MDTLLGRAPARPPARLFRLLPTHDIRINRLTAKLTIRAQAIKYPAQGPVITVVVDVVHAFPFVSRTSPCRSH